MTGRQKDPIKSMHVDFAKKGGFVARHSFDNAGNGGESYRPDETYALSTPDEAIAHFAKHAQAHGKVSKQEKDAGPEHPMSGVSRPAPAPKRLPNSQQPGD
jgi:hypothetical protein